jgi:hypothetical protein
VTLAKAVRLPHCEQKRSLLRSWVPHFVQNIFVLREKIRNVGLRCSMSRETGPCPPVILRDVGIQEIYSLAWRDRKADLGSFGRMTRLGESSAAVLMQKPGLGG